MSDQMIDTETFHSSDAESEIRTLRWCIVIDAFLFAVLAIFGARLPTYVVSLYPFQ